MFPKSPICNSLKATWEFCLFLFILLTQLIGHNTPEMLNKPDKCYLSYAQILFDMEKGDNFKVFVCFS